MIKRGVDNDVENEDKGKLVAGVTVGSVTTLIFFSPTRVKVSSSASPPDGAGNSEGKTEYKTYASGTDRLRYFTEEDVGNFVQAKRQMSEQDYVNFMRAPFLPPA
jgi:hypothetical protein